MNNFYYRLVSLTNRNSKYELIKKENLNPAFTILGTGGCVKGAGLSGFTLFIRSIQWSKRLFVPFLYNGQK